MTVTIWLDSWEREAHPADEECPALLDEMETFYSDPMTEATGMGSECAPIVRAGHLRRHGCGGLAPSPDRTPVLRLHEPRPTGYR